MNRSMNCIFHEDLLDLINIAEKIDDFYFSNLYLALQQAKKMLQGREEIIFVEGIKEEYFKRSFFFTLSSIGYTLCLVCDETMHYHVVFTRYRLFRRSESFNRNTMYFQYIDDKYTLHYAIAFEHEDLAQEFDEATTEEENLDIYSELIEDFIGIVVACGNLLFIYPNQSEYH